MSQTDLWSTADWVLSVTDAALEQQKLNELFESIIFATVPEEEEGSDDGDGAAAAAGRKLLTAAQRKRQKEEDEELRNARKELEGESEEAQGEEEDDSDIFDFDKISEEEEAENQQRELAAEDLEFQQWIGHDESDVDEDEVDRILDEEAEAVVPGQQSLDTEMERIGLSRKKEEEAELAPLPERLQQIWKRKKQYERLPSGQKCTIDKSAESVWILKQLCRPLQPFARNHRLCNALATLPVEEAMDEPAAKAIKEALFLLFEDHMEPAHVMMYRQSTLAPLLYELWISDSEIGAGASNNNNNSSNDSSPEVQLSFAYCTGTGRRERPIFYSKQFTSFPYVSSNVAEDANSAWQGKARSYVCRRPTTIELGHLLLEIVELDLQCHRLEHARHSQLELLRSKGTPDCIDAAEILEGIFFTSSIEGDMWSQYTSTLIRDEPARWSQFLIRRKLHRFLGEFCITPSHYQTNLAAGRAVYRSHNSTEPAMWKKHVERATDLPIDTVMSALHKAVVEQFSVLPLLRRRVLDLMATEATVVLKYANNSRRERFPVSSIVTENPRAFLTLLERQAAGELTITYAIDEATLVRSLNQHNMFTAAEVGTEWDNMMLNVLYIVGRHVAERETAHLTPMLRSLAEASVKTQCAKALANFCAIGPYEKTKLVLEQFDPVRVTWEADWNVVEALRENPVDFEFDKAPPRVCGAYRTPNNTTYFVCTDTCGVVVDTLRWIDAAPRNSNLYKEQQIKFREMLRRWEPNVIAVAASGGEIALGLMMQLQRFVRDVVHVELKVHIPCIWTSVTIPSAFAASPMAEVEFAGKDPYFKACVSVARVTRDPLLELCQLFDENRSVLSLPLGLHTLAKADAVYERLKLEVTLWIAACGIEILDVMKLPNPTAVLQFVPGLGPRRAVDLSRQLQMHPVGSREDVSAQLLKLSPFVETNAGPALRMRPSGSISDSYHVLDASLIPRAWYPLAAVVAYGIKRGRVSDELALLTFLSLPAEKKQELVLRAVDDDRYLCEELSKKAQSNRRHNYSHIDEREVEFVVDELVNLGRSTMRRTYRQMTSQQLFHACTGVTYLQRSSKEVPCGLHIREGDYVEGIITDIRAGGVQGIRLKTTHGVAGFMSLEDIPLNDLKDELTTYLRDLEELKAKRTNHEEVDMSTLRVPEWLRRGAPIQGQVSGCMFDRCELRVRYTEPNDTLPPEESAVVQQDDHALETQSIRTVQLAECAVSSNRLKVSQHVLFRNVESYDDVKRLLQQKRIGECIFWPVQGQSQRFIVSVSIGNDSISSFKVMEIRQANGQFAYCIKDQRTLRTYNFTDPDHLVAGFVNKVAQSVQDFRRHRRFFVSVAQAKTMIQNQLKQGVLAYAFVELHNKGTPYYYCVLYGTSAGEKRLDVHFSGEHIYIKQPKIDGGESEWMCCSTAELVSVYVKRLHEDKLGRKMSIKKSGGVVGGGTRDRRATPTNVPQEPVDLNAL